MTCCRTLPLRCGLRCRSFVANRRNVLSYSASRTTVASLTYRVWLLILVAWTVGLWLGRGNWQAETQSTAAFVRVSVSRCRSRLVAICFAAVFYAVELIFVIAWKQYYFPVDLQAVLASPVVIMFIAVVTPIFFSCLAVCFGRTRMRLRYLLEVQRELETNR
jgi:hypothetical protein